MKNPLRTVLVISLGFTVIYAATGATWALGIALTVGILGAFSNRLATWIDWAWMKLAWVLSLIVPNILLSIIFYGFLFPVALLSRVFGKRDPLLLKRPSASLWQTVDRTPDRESFEKTW